MKDVNREVTSTHSEDVSRCVNAIRMIVGVPEEEAELEDVARECRATEVK